MNPVIQVQQLTKRYSGANVDSLKKVDLTINLGEKLGVFGPNGAGKTTLMSSLCGIFKYSSGEITYFENGRTIDLKNMLYKIGYVPQDFAFYPELTPFQNLIYFGTLYSIPKEELKTKIQNLLSVLGLDHVIHKKVKTFSGGMKRRVNLAIGIINEPKILFLDEPTVGVDVQSKNAIMAYLEELNKKGTTIIYTSHHMSEGQDFCDRIVLLDHGMKIADAPLEELLMMNNQQSLEDLFLQLTGTELRD